MSTLANKSNIVRWSIWIQLILGGFIQIVHFFTVPETRSTILMNRIAKKRRKETNANIWGPDELVPFRDRFSAKEILITWTRPFKMFLTEPIVLVLSLLSGFSDALIFMFIQSFALVYAQWDFSTIAVGLSFIPIGIGYLIAWLAFIPAIWKNVKERKEKPHDERAQYESRLWFLLYTAPCLPIGLIGFAWTIQGPPIHWIGSMIFAAIVGIANYSIYMATIDYMICACEYPHPLKKTYANYKRRSLLCFSNWWQRLGSRFPRWCLDSTRHALLPKHWKVIRQEPRIRLNNPVLHLVCACSCRVRHLLEGSNPAKEITVCPTVGG